MSALTITNFSSLEVFHNRYSISCNNPYDFTPVDLAIIQKLAEDLGAVNPMVVDRHNTQGTISRYLLADTFTTLQPQLNKCFHVSNQFLYEEHGKLGISYLAQIDSNLFYHDYPLSFWDKLNDDEITSDDQWINIEYHKARKHYPG